MVENLIIKEVEPTEKELLQQIQAAGRADNLKLDPKDVEEIPEKYQNLETKWTSD